MKSTKEILKDSNISSVMHHKSLDLTNLNRHYNPSDEEVVEIEEHLIIDLEDENNIENSHENEDVEPSKLMKSNVNTADNNRNSTHKNKVSKPVHNNGPCKQKNNDSKVFYVVDIKKNIIKVDLINHTYEVVYIDRKEEKKSKKASDPPLSLIKCSQKLKESTAFNAKSRIDKNNLKTVSGIKENKQQINESTTSFDSTQNVKCIKIPILPVSLKTENLKNFFNCNNSNLINIQAKNPNNSRETSLNTIVSTQQSNKKDILLDLADKNINEQQNKLNSNVLINSINCVESSNQTAILNTENSQKLSESNKNLLLIKPISDHDYFKANISKFSSVKPTKYLTFNTQTKKLEPIHGFVTAVPIVHTNQLKTDSRLIPKLEKLKAKENSRIIINKKHTKSDLQRMNLSTSTYSQKQESKEIFGEKICHKQNLVQITMRTIVPVSKTILLTNEKKQLESNPKKLLIDTSVVEQKKVYDNKTNIVSNLQIESKQKFVTSEILGLKVQETSGNIKENINENKQISNLKIPNRLMIIKNNEVSVSEEILLTGKEKKKILDGKSKPLTINLNNKAGKVPSFGSSPQLALIKLSCAKENLKSDDENLVSRYLKRKMSESSKAAIAKKLDAPVFECCICKIKLRSIELLNEHYKNHPESKVFFSSKLRERHKLFCSSKKKFYKCKKCIKFSGYPF